MQIPSGDQSTRLNKYEAYAHVIRALVLRDMRTRFGGSHWGYAVLVLWPVVHIFILVAIMAFRDLPSPLGESPLLYVATGCVPALTFQYMSREVMKAVATNKPLMYYPQVKIFDVMIARFIVEAVKSYTCLIIVVALLASLGVNPMPADPVTAICAFSASMLLGIGFGAMNIGIVSFFPAWQLGYIVVTITFYLTCGTVFLPHLLPDQLYQILKWLPMVQIVEWMRQAYYPGMDVDVDYIYVLLWGGVTLMLGLISERTIVRRLA
jgi:capsular polysaccharide transport system permease protein